ncbi:MAG: translation initiation factor IF-6 [Candidatus Micrarchaeia archaeon]|jgi:translation initiation factor 6
MSVIKAAIYGNSYVGIFGYATDNFCLIGSGVPAKKAEAISSALGVELIRTTVDSSQLVGIYTIANSKGVLLPKTIEEREYEDIRKKLSSIEVKIFDTDLNALRNNILVNDKIAIINPSYTKKEEKFIEDVLDVEVVKMSIGGFGTVGANNIMTNKGIVFNNRIGEEEKKKLEEIVGFDGEQSTANLGSLNIGLSTIANSNGLVVGEITTGHELARIANSLNL